MDRRQALRKLAVGGAIVWTAPLLSKTAHAAGATSCTSHVLDWNGFTVGSTFSSATVAGVTATLKPSSFFGGTTALASNGTIRVGPQGGVPGQALHFEQKPVNNGGQLITLGFSQTVYSVSFTITDIDNLNNAWSDRIVVISPTNFTFTKPATSTVIGAGTATGTTTTTGMFRNSQASNNISNASDAGNVTLTFPGPLTEFGFEFRSANPAGGANQLINLTNIGFCS
ncbi:MAG: hypothetical protein JWM47_946 [Acidimicrobiales bacterium]|nr:hypothetical protein [Acidimicrobiales bacterium]